MNTHNSNQSLHTALLTAVALAIGTATIWSAEIPALKEVYKDRFQVGAAVNRGLVAGTSSRRSQELLIKDIELVKHQFNHLVAENDMKWALIHPRPGEDGYSFGPADAFVDFGLKNGMYLAGHTLVWHSQTPQWVFAGTNPPPPEVTNASPGPDPSTNLPGTDRLGRGRFGGGFFGPYTGPRASREELLERMRDHIHTVAGRYRGKIKVWDVVNEAIADNGTNILRNSLWMEIIGPDFIAKAFQYAHEADSEAILRYNDYGLENPAKRQKLIALIKSLQAQKVPVHAIGSQAHLNVSITFETMDQALAEMATLGLPIHITELDVNSAQGGQRGFGADVAENATTTQGGLVSDADQRLAEAYAGIFRAFLKHDKAVEIVTFWGANDANSWRSRGKPLLFDINAEPKPAFHAVVAEAKNAAAIGAPAAPVATANAAPAEARRSGQRTGPDLGPLPELHAPVPNTSPGLLGKPLKWKSTGVLVAPQNDPTHFLYSVKDPTVFKCQDKWHVYATAFMVSGPAAATLLNPDADQPAAGERRGDRGGWSMVYLNFADGKDAPNARLFYRDTVPRFGGYRCAPEVFYFAPQKKWYSIFQTQRPAYSISETPDDPRSWTAPQQFFTPDIPTPRLPIDYPCIGDGEHMYLFFTGDDGNFYRRRTTYAEFPKGFGAPVIAMRGTREITSCSFTRESPVPATAVITEGCPTDSVCSAL